MNTLFHLVDLLAKIIGYGILGLFIAQGGLLLATMFLNFCNENVWRK